LAERASEYREYAESGQAYNEYRKGYDGGSVEYRYADFLLALGEAIMINHPRFCGFAPRWHDGKKTVLSADILAKYADPITDAIRRNMHDSEFLDLYEVQGGGRWIHSLAKVPHDLQTDQTMRHLLGDFARRAAREADDYQEHLSDEPGLI